jgi:uncharacterized protein YoxC
MFEDNEDIVEDNKASQYVLDVDDDDDDESGDEVDELEVHGSILSEAVDKWRALGFKFVQVGARSSDSGSMAGANVPQATSSFDGGFDYIGKKVRFFLAKWKNSGAGSNKHRVVRLVHVDGVIACQHVMSKLTTEHNFADGAKSAASAASYYDLSRWGVILANEYAVTVSVHTVFNALLAYQCQWEAPSTFCNAVFSDDNNDSVVHSIPACCILPIKHGAGIGLNSDFEAHKKAKDAPPPVIVPKVSVATSTSDLSYECKHCVTRLQKLETLRHDHNRLLDKYGSLSDAVGDKSKQIQSLQSSKRKLEDALAAEKEKTRTKVNADELSAANSQLREITRAMEALKDSHSRELMYAREQERKNFFAKAALYGSDSASIAAAQISSSSGALTTAPITISGGISSSKSPVKNSSSSSGSSGNKSSASSNALVDRSSHQRVMMTLILGEWKSLRDAVLVTARLERVELTRELSTTLRTTAPNSNGTASEYQTNLLSIIEQTETIFAKRNTLEKAR